MDNSTNSQEQQESKVVFPAVASIKDMSQEELLSEGFLRKIIFETESEVEREVVLAGIRSRATELKCGRSFNSIVSALKSEKKAADREEERAVQTYENSVSVPWDASNERSGGMRLNTGKWEVSKKDGVVKPGFMMEETIACRHLIYPSKMITNIVTGEKKVELVFYKEGRYQAVTVSREVISGKSSIIQLSRLGIDSNDSNCKALVEYLADIEALNPHITKVKSASKMGWVQDGNKMVFLPYSDAGIVFDADNRFRAVREAITDHGERDAWVNHMKALRYTCRIEIKAILAASFASALIKPLNALPFIVDLWGSTEAGKSVCMMVAASVWADPSGSRFIGDYQSTATAFEIRCDFLNSLPNILDDTSKINEKTMKELQTLVYALTSGKGRSRSDSKLGLNDEKTWQNVTITCGEKPLTSYVSQAGGINRTVEIEADESIFPDPARTISVIQQNYGFAGREFIDAIKKLGSKELKQIYDDFYRKISALESMKKQAASVAILLTADKLANDYIFQDGGTLTMDEAAVLLTDPDEVSDGQRAYDFIMDKIAMNPGRFEKPTSYDYVETWGRLDADRGIVYFYPAALESLLKDIAVSRRQFLTWARKKDLLITDGDKKRFGKTAAIASDDRVTKCYCLVLRDK